ncbi:HAMP domain-containing sensor histidine kinase [Endozoicomonas montiporae]|uniref:histidine kinase n=1 Tax=Endozoicomonas montiporae CL-33 TaxID=570277 RepID=A0A142B8X7_9GAMM|nr:HAMP domain-containing sensor histidine kinase [Endozoicomonas montiporae]AMO55203.1 two-component sensor kinase [Endozoicomonas montiporae CL-33]
MQTLYRYFSKLTVSSKLLHLLIGIALSVGLVASSTFMASAWLISKHQFDPTHVLATAGLIVAASLLSITLITAEYVRHFITRPILHLIRIAGKVSKQEDYRIRARVFHKDETGTLSQTFNVMLSRIATRDQQLQEEKEYERQLLTRMQQNNRELEHEILVRQKAERKLKQFQEYLNNIINSMPSALITVDDQQTIQQCNTEAARLAATEHSDTDGMKIICKKVVGQTMTRAFPFLEHCQTRIETTFREQSIQRIEKLPVIIDGNDSYLDLIIYPLSGEESSEKSGEEHPEAVIRIDDITQRLKLEEVMVQTEKMMTVGGLAAGMAHEINNPLGAIIQGTQNIRRRISVDLPANEHTAHQHDVDLQQLNAYLEDRGINRFLDNIQSAGLRASEIVRNMLKFSRHSEPVLSSANLHELLKKTVDIAASDLNWQSEFDFMRIRVDYDLDPDLTEVPCIASELQQVLLNLLKNAAHAINQRQDKTELGRIRITTRYENEQVMISLSDNGCGMSDRVRKRIFEPFYTTKDIGVGTGLGLSVSYFIITTHHQGTMTVESTPEQGSRFIIHLPPQRQALPSTVSKNEVSIG